MMDVSAAENDSSYLWIYGEEVDYSAASSSSFYEEYLHARSTSDELYSSS